MIHLLTSSKIQMWLSDFNKRICRNEVYLGLIFHCHIQKTLGLFNMVLDDVGTNSLFSLNNSDCSDCWRNGLVVNWKIHDRDFLGDLFFWAICLRKWTFYHKKPPYQKINRVYSAVYSAGNIRQFRFKFLTWRVQRFPHPFGREDRHMGINQSMVGFIMAIGPSGAQFGL